MNAKLTKASENVLDAEQVNKEEVLELIQQEERRAREVDIQDVKRARRLFTHQTEQDEQNELGWLALARTEKQAGMIGEARKVLERACRIIPKKPDIWFERANLAAPNEAKAILVQAVQHCPKSEKLWLYAARVEQTEEMKAKILHKALEQLPESVALWKESVDNAIESREEAKNLLL